MKNEIILLFIKCYIVGFVLLFTACSSSIDVVVDEEGYCETKHYIIVFGDIQMYTYGWAIKYYQSSIDWIQRQVVNGVDICAVLEVGDVTQYNMERQWGAFRQTTETLAQKVPFFVCTGNHDYDWKGGGKIVDRQSTLINDYAHFPLSDESIVDYYDGTSLENYIARIRIGNENIYLLVLEFGPREDVLDWAIKCVKEHPMDRFLLMTHEWLDSRGKRMVDGTYAEIQFEGYSSYSTPEQIWDKLVKDNDNIFCVLCGHEENFSCFYETQNAFGRNVPQLLFNLQFLPNGGNGIVQIWQIEDSGRDFNICAYDTITDNWYLRDSTSYTVSIRY